VEPTGTYTLAKPLPLPSPPPPRIPPPRCVPEDQADNNYEWRYSKTKKLGSKDRGFRVSHEFSISYAGKAPPLQDCGWCGDPVRLGRVVLDVQRPSRPRSRSGRDRIR
jgi:hypothetical protein